MTTEEIKLLRAIAHHTSKTYQILDSINQDIEDLKCDIEDVKETMKLIEMNGRDY